MQRANRQEIPNNRHQQEAPFRQEAVQREETARRQETPLPDYPQFEQPSPIHPLHRYATPPRLPPEAGYSETSYNEAPAFAESDPEPDPSRYDEALYGQLAPDAQEPQYDQAYGEDDQFGYQDGYGDNLDEEPAPKRRSGVMTIVIVLALAVVGTGGAFAYRTYVAAPRSGEPPIIRAEAGPTKIMPSPADSTGKLPDRMATGDGAERLVPREESPVDVNAKSSGPRVVFPPLNQNANPPAASSVATNAIPPSSGNGTLPANEPRKIRTLAVRGDQPDGAAAPVGAAPPAAPKPTPATRSVANANASTNAPISLTPGAQPAAEPRARVAATNPDQAAAPAAPPPAAAAAAAGGSGYMVQLSSQRSESDAQASFKALQGKFPTQLGSREAVIKRAELGEKGVYYRALVGPFASSDEATQFCGNLKTAGGQCLVPRN
jgi:hypothetical protein